MKKLLNLSTRLSEFQYFSESSASRLILFDTFLEVLILAFWSEVFQGISKFSTHQVLTTFILKILNLCNLDENLFSVNLTSECLENNVAFR